MLLTCEFLIRHQCPQTPVLHPWTHLNELLLEEHRCLAKTIMEQQKYTSIVVDVAYAAQVKSYDQDD